jgi:hypothetical protein
MTEMPMLAPISARVMISFATKLRLTPQSHTRAEALGRKRDSQEPLSYYERARLGRLENGEEP